MTFWRIDIDDEQGTQRLGHALAGAIEPGDVICLMGTLGAGKTRLVQAVAAGLGVVAEVTSPTFMLVHQYAGRLPVYHLDAYRLRDEDEFAELGPEEFFEGEGVTLIEWADRVAGLLPSDRLEIRLETIGPTARSFVLTAHGPRAGRLAAAVMGADAATRPVAASDS